MKYTHAVNSFTVSCTWVLFLSSCSLCFVLPRQTVFLSSTLFFFNNNFFNFFELPKKKPKLRRFAPLTENIELTTVES